MRESPTNLLPILRLSSDSYPDDREIPHFWYFDNYVSSELCWSLMTTLYIAGIF